jgi:hypothetical protein
MGRLVRFGVEVAFLVALAAALVLAEAEPLVIAGGMLAGWALVALFEWAGLRGRPHYGAGLPPRYYVPQVSLPPPRPLEQLRAGYPVPGDRDEEATWIAPPEVLESWPVGGASTPPASARQASSVSEDTIVDELLPLALAEHGIDPWLEGPLEEAAAGAPPPAGPEPEPEPDEAADAEPVPVEATVVEELAVEVEELVVEDGPDGAVVEAIVVEEAVLVAEQSVEAAVAPAAGLARHRLDPLAEPAQRRRFSRRQEQDGAVVEVPARPERPRALPGRASRERGE